MKLGLSLATALLLLAAPSGVRAEGLTYLVHTPAKPQPHPPLILLMHGSGSDERDMITLWPQLPDDLVVVSPRAPFGDAGGGFRWYRRPAASRAADAELSRKIVDDVLDNAVKRFDADPKRIFVGGFSQGAVMTLHLALAEPGRFRGAAVLSGSLLPGDGGRLPAGADPKQVSVFIGHGTADNRIPAGAATAAKAALDRLGVPVAFHIYPGMGHETGAAEVADLSRWLAEEEAKP